MPLLPEIKEAIEMHKPRMKKLRNYADRYAKLGWIPITCDIYYDEERQKYCKPPCKRNWTKINQSNWKWRCYFSPRPQKYMNGSDVHLGIKTGSVSGIIVIDVDNKNDTLKYWKKIMKKCKLDDCNMVYQKTPSGGYHYVFKYDDRLTNIDHCFHYKGKVLDIDVRSNGGFIAVAPSYQGTPDKTYEWVDRCNLNRKVPILPEKMFDFYNESYENKKTTPEDSEKKTYTIKNKPERQTENYRVVKKFNYNIFNK